MSRAAALLVLVLALVSALVASVMVVKYLRQQAQPAPAETKPVLIAKVNIPVGTAIKPEQIVVAQRSPETIPVGAAVSEEEVRECVTRATILAGQTVMRSLLTKRGTPGGLSARIPKGFRAITLKVDDTTSLAGFIRPGHHVDVLATIRSRDAAGDTTTKAVLQNVEVIAAGAQLEQSREGQEGQKTEAKKIQTVTVLATLEQTERLALADDAGDIRLVLRNHIEDQEEEVTPGATVVTLLARADEGPNKPKPTPPPMPVPILQPTLQPAPEPTPEPTPQLITIPVYRGSQVTEMTFILNQERNRFELYRQTGEASEQKKASADSGQSTSLFSGGAVE